METTHEVHVDDARDLPLADDSVDLVVTSPPYPMISMWDGLFTELDPAVGDALDEGDGRRAHERMHDALDAAWREVARVLRPGGIACVNVGDATRTFERFRVYDNHSRVTEAFETLGFDALPSVVWRKPANSATKFMGSGMLPPNAYVTQEHEHVLVFRNGERRDFDAGADRRYEAAYFWEERNRWFSDVWTDLNGETQSLEGPGLRERSAAFPLALPYRLVNMYSVYGDTVLDPFWGTGTTSQAAAVAGRHSVGVERDSGFADAFSDRIQRAPERSRTLASDRLAAHREYVANAADEFEYEAEYYDARVRTKQERRIRFYEVTDVAETETGWRATHVPYEE
ncbi:DNA-methyltransferase [Halobacterium zhouii]|uniref:DNA-methyltransferase n=1 Tax=Halobacterium zhouii TaxID=2902624 RepID=UPI001E2C04A8|nr:site-specific DNA-methyltransferase [Halobacterium zhouii]